MLNSYHVHTRWSDGEGEVVDFIRAAKAMGLDEVGFSDHYVLKPYEKPEHWSMDLDLLDDYVCDVQSSSIEAGEDLIVRLGIEADYFPETVDELRKVLMSQPFDYVIGSVHRLDGFPIDDVAEDWAPLAQDECDDIIRRYWVRVREMAESGMFDIAGHLDLTKKFAVYPSIDISREISEALDAVAAADMVFELNTAGWYKLCQEQYPSREILIACRERNIPIIVTADAHKPEDLIRGYDEAFRIVREIGYTEIASFAGRQRFMHPIE